MKELRAGMLEVIPSGLLEGSASRASEFGAKGSLTAEELRLLLSGMPEVDLRTLQRCTVWHDESGLPAGPSAAQRVAAIQEWFWLSVAHFDRPLRHELVSEFRIFSLLHLFLPTPHA